MSMSVSNQEGHLVLKILSAHVGFCPLFHESSQVVQMHLYAIQVAENVASSNRGIEQTGLIGILFDPNKIHITWWTFPFQMISPKAVWYPFRCLTRWILLQLQLYTKLRSPGVTFKMNHRNKDSILEFCKTFLWNMFGNNTSENTCNVTSSGSIFEFIIDSPFATCFAPIPKLVQTPNKVAMIENTSTKSPTQPKMLSPING